MTGVVIVRKRDAKTNPPEVAGNHVTDQGCLYWNFDGWLHDSDRIADPQPLWWYDLRPTANERLGLGVSGGSPPPKGFEIVRETATQPLTIEHLEDLYEHAVSPPNTTWSRYVRIAAARLRAALDALTKEADSDA